MGLGWRLIYPGCRVNLLLSSILEGTQRIWTKSQLGSKHDVGVGCNGLARIKPRTLVQQGAKCEGDDGHMKIRAR
jgi:hypothetical protein